MGFPVHISTLLTHAHKNPNTHWHMHVYTYTPQLPHIHCVTLFAYEEPAVPLCQHRFLAKNKKMGIYMPHGSIHTVYSVFENHLPFLSRNSLKLSYWINNDCNVTDFCLFQKFNAFQCIFSLLILCLKMQ